MKHLILKVKRNSGKFTVTDISSGKEVYGALEYYVKKKAYTEGTYIVVNTTISTKANGKIKGSAMRYATKEQVDAITDSATKTTPVVTETLNPMMQLVTASYKAKNELLKISELKWKILARNVLKNKNTMLVGPSGCGKTSVAIEVAKSLNFPSYVANFGSTQDPRSALIGQNQYSKEQGTYFQESNFIKALETENCVIILDELSRAHPEAFNIVLPLLDFQKTMRIEESNRVITVADGVSFIATANIGLEYTSTRTMDRALIDRFIPIEIDFISKNDELNLIKAIHTNLENTDATNIVNFVDLVRQELSSESPKISTHISTRVVIEIAGLCADGFNLYDAVVYTVLPNYDKDGGADSERTFILQVLQKFVTKESKRSTATKTTAANIDADGFTIAEF